MVVLHSLEAQPTLSFTFDDGSLGDKAGYALEDWNSMILNHLDEAQVKSTFFVRGDDKSGKKGKYLLQSWNDKGHQIANHTLTHPNFDKDDITIEHFKQEIAANDSVINGYSNYVKLFRFPYLDEGRDEDKSQGMIDFLKKQGYKNGYVTVDNYDWYLDSLYQQAVKANLEIDMEKLKALYVDVLYEAITFSDGIAMKYLKRSPKHVLLLHDNDLAAYFIDDLVLRLKANGWEIISPLEAFEDPIAKQEPKTLFKGQGRVAALARDAGAKRKDLVHAAEDESKLKQMFEDYQVVSEKSAEMPAWFLQEMESQVGVRKASNAKYQSENEPFSDYVIEWTWGIGKDKVNGRMYGIKDDQPTYDFWEFKMYWDADRKQARLIQWGNGGMLADGFIRQAGEDHVSGQEAGQTESIQTLSSPHMASRLERHLNTPTAEGLITTSYSKDEQGEWQAQRSYLWVKQKDKAADN